MSNGDRPTKPPPGPPRPRPLTLPGMPSRHLRGADDPVAARLAELEDERKRLELEAEQAKTELARALEAKAEAEARAAVAAVRVESDHSEPPPRSRRDAFSIRVREWDGLIKFVVGVTSLASLVIGVFNLSAKAPNPKVDRVEEKQDQLKTRIEGPESEGGLARRLVKTEERLRRIEELRCPEQHYLAQALDRAGVHGIEVQGCPAPEPLDVTPDKGLPGRGGKQGYVVITPMPAP